MTAYDRDLTFTANAEALLEARGVTDPALCMEVINMLRDAYDDGWHDARAHQLAGLEIPETSTKWD